MEWPPKSGRQAIPELDRAEWLTLEEAHCKLLKGQAVFLARLAEVLVESEK